MAFREQDRRAGAMPCRSAYAVEFLSQAREWIERNGEVLTMIRHHGGAGSKEFLLVRSFEEFENEIRAVPARTCIIVFRDRQLPVRGTVDAELTRRALSAIAEDAAWLMVDLQETVIGKRSWTHWVDDAGRDTLRAELEDRLGDEVAIGAYPPWLRDSDEVISAVVPDADGRVIRGTY